MTPCVQAFYDDMYPGQIVYVCKGVDDDLLDAIRKDPGVDWVCCDHAGVVPTVRKTYDAMRHSIFANELFEA